MSASEEPIKQCPVCDYKGHGAAASARCPRCGCHCDDTRFARTSFLGWPTTILGGLTSVLCALVALSQRKSLAPGAFEALLSIAGGLAVLAMLAAVVRRRSFVAVTPFGVAWRRWPASVRTMSFDEIDFPENASRPKRIFADGRRRFWRPPVGPNRKLESEVYFVLRQQLRKQGRAAPEGTLAMCPVCGYDLRGLPAEHRCPECGFEYDETTRVWYGCYHREAVADALQILGMALVASYGLIQSSGRKPLAGLASGFLMLIVICWLVIAVRSRHQTRVLIVDAKGITFPTWSKPRTIRWSDIRYRPSSLWPVHVEYGREKDIPFPIHNMCDQEVEELQRALREEWQRALGKVAPRAHG